MRRFWLQGLVIAGLTCWRDLCLILSTMVIRKDAPRVEIVVGNHATILRQEQVRLSSGEATLAFARRTPPAAAPFGETTLEYWLMLFRQHPSRCDMWVAYAVGAVIHEDPERAKAELLELAPKWQIPRLFSQLRVYPEEFVVGSSALVE